MIECSACGNGEVFVQGVKGYRRQVAVMAERGAFRARKGVWRQARKHGLEGFACAECGQEVALSARLRKVWGLDDVPIQTAPSVDLDGLLEQVRGLARGAEIKVQETHAGPGTFGSFDELNVPILKVFRERVEDGLGVPLDRLFSHQVEALRHALGGKNVVLQTPTASGKTLCYLLPTFKTLLEQPKATALYVFPLKALAFDQRKKIAALAGSLDESLLEANCLTWPLKFGPQTVWMGCYERETEGEDQAEVKKKARLVVTNPDSLHVKMLPHFSTRTGSWERFFANLKHVVLDEIHTYRGVFGAHVAYVIRRLRMICERLGARPQFFCSSATLPSPRSHAEELVGLPFEAVTESGSPRSRKAFVLWNPGPVPHRAGEAFDRREPTTEAIEILTEALLTRERPVQTITFVRTLGGVERFNMTLKKRLQAKRSPCVDRVRTYKSTLILEDRNEVTDGLISGQVVHVTATSALELGIDIGDMNACLMIGYPGTVSSTLQQSGRVGRKGDSIVILLLRDDPLEQWFGRNPEQFFKHLERIEPIRLPIQNPHVLSQQMSCAAWDLNPTQGRERLGGLTEDLVERYFGKGSRLLVQKTREKAGRTPFAVRGTKDTYWVVTDAFDEVFQSIRVPISTGKFRVIDDRRRVAGECDSTVVTRDLFPGAIWINDGRFYLAKKILYEEQEVEVKFLESGEDYYTIALPQTAIACHEETAQTRSAAGITLGKGQVTVRREVKLYRKIPAAGEGEEEEEVCGTRTQPIEYDATAFWLDLPEAALRAWGIPNDAARPGAHALEHALRSVFPVVADVDPGDLGSTLDAGNDRKKGFRCRLYLFDSFSGGTGLSEFAFEKPRELLTAARDLVESCPCKEPGGCPRCVIISWCERRNEDLSKEGALALLGRLEQVV
ncbi:MAG: DEAD/DEAH box helicase [Planctomycetes bacterium]|nr:DEAD/DEAH box helicase [Planctomycetota bacterium]